MDPNSSETVEDASGCNDDIKTIGIENLPDEIMLQVFELFTHKEILTQLSLVSRHWQELAQDPSLYRKLEIRRKQPITRMAVKLVKMAPWLVSVNIHGREDADEILRHVGSETPRLTELRLSQCKVTLQSFPYLQNCTKLRDVRLWRNAEDVQTEIWLHVVKYCQEVEIIHFSELYDNAFAMMCNKFWNSLRVLEYRCLSPEDSTWFAVARCTNLSTLHLISASRISEESLTAIGGLRNLVDLYIHRAELMTTQGWMRLFRQAMLEKLTNLRLVNCQGVDDDVKRAIMKRSTVLKYLVLRDCDYVTGLTLVEVRQLISHLKLDELLMSSVGLSVTAFDGVYF